MTGLGTGARATALALATLVALGGTMASAREAQARKGGGASPLLPDGDFLPVTPEQAALADVSFAPGAPAVILFEGAQHDWGEGAGLTHRVTYHRRLKVLTAAGAASHGDFVYRLYGDVRVRQAAARTVRPDGSVVDCTSDVSVEGSKEGDLHEVRIAWPQVEPGAILDVRVSWTSQDLGLSPWIVQHDLPVLESRLVVTPYGQMRYRTAAFGLTPEQASPEQVRRVGGSTYYWDVEDVPPLPDVPFAPPDDERASQLLLIVESIDLGSYREPYAPDWPTFAKERAQDWKRWQGQRAAQATALAKQVCEGATTPQEKAEAVRRALADRVRVDWQWWWPGADSADEVLSAGHGRSADVAALAAAMLAAVGVPSRPAAYRPHDDGVLPPDAPLPSILEDLLLEVQPRGGASFWFAPGARMPAGTLPVEARGVNVVPFDDGIAGVVTTPELTPDENGTSWDAQATLDAAGRFEAQLVMTCRGADAAAWRDELADLSPDARRQAVQESLATHVSALRVDAMEIAALDDPTAPLVVTCLVSADGAAQAAGSRLLWNPNMFARVDASDWAATSRTVAIDLGRPFRDESRISVTLPPGTASASLPAAQVADGGAIGRYELSFSGKGRTIVARRTLEMKATRFPAESWDGLRSWFAAIATAEDQPLVATVGEAPASGPAPPDTPPPDLPAPTPPEGVATPP